MNLILVIQSFRVILEEFRKEMLHRDVISKACNGSQDLQDMLRSRMYNAAERARYISWYVRVLEWSPDGLIDPLETDDELAKYFTEDGPVEPY